MNTKWRVASHQTPHTSYGCADGDGPTRIRAAQIDSPSHPSHPCEIGTGPWVKFAVHCSRNSRKCFSIVTNSTSVCTQKHAADQGLHFRSQARGYPTTTKQGEDHQPSTKQYTNSNAGYSSGTCINDPHLCTLLNQFSLVKSAYAPC